MREAGQVVVIGAPADLGVEPRGVDGGPGAMRRAGLVSRLGQAGCKVEDGGNLRVPGRAALTGCSSGLANLEAVLETNRFLAREVARVSQQGRVPLVLGGDHSLTIGSTAGVAAGNGPIGLLYFDAHGDFNVPETSPSGNIHGMSLAAAVGQGHAALANCHRQGPQVDGEKVVVLGCRDLDTRERQRAEASPVRFVSVKDIERRGMAPVMAEALARVSAGTHGYHVSFDLDVLDPGEAPGVGTPVPAGLSFRDSLVAMDMAREWGGLVALDLVEVNPLLEEYDRTAEMAVELAVAGLGQKRS